MDEDVEVTVGKTLDIAQRQLDSLEGHIKRCEFLETVDAYASVTATLQNASLFAQELPHEEWQVKIGEIRDLHNKKHELTKLIPEYCECLPRRR